MDISPNQVIDVEDKARTINNPYPTWLRRGILTVIRTIILFVLAGIAEIGGGWLVWQWLREHRSLAIGLVGAGVLVLYGVIPTFQEEPAFGRVYAAYGGIFVVLSLVWAWKVENWQPDRYDIIGAAIALVGVVVIMWGRRLF